MEIHELISVLKALSIFKSMSESEIANFFQEFSPNIMNFGKDDVIFFEDEECKNLSIVLRGTVEIQKIDPSGKVLTVARISAGDAFGENLIFGDNNKYPMTVISKNKTIILNLSKNAVIKLCQIDQTFLYEFLRLLSNKAISLSSKIKEVALKNIRQKICDFILWKYRISKENVIEISMSKKDWAEKLGVQRPSLSRELIKMKEEGLIDYDKEKIFIKDIDTIKEYV
jgi:CRP-like cAMP-binding protein